MIVIWLHVGTRNLKPGCQCRWKASIHSTEIALPNNDYAQAGSQVALRRRVGWHANHYTSTPHMMIFACCSRCILQSPPWPMFLRGVPYTPRSGRLQRARLSKTEIRITNWMGKVWAQVDWCLLLRLCFCICFWTTWMIHIVWFLNALCMFCPLFIKT